MDSVVQEVESTVLGKGLELSSVKNHDRFEINQLLFADDTGIQH